MSPERRGRRLDFVPGPAAGGDSRQLSLRKRLGWAGLGGGELPPPPSAARGRRSPCPAPPGWSRTLTSAGPAEAAGHKGSFVGQRLLRARGGTKRPGSGSAPRRRGRRRVGGWGPGTRDPAYVHLPVPAPPQGPEYLARDERPWPPDRKEIDAPQPPLPPEYLGPFLLPLPPRLRAEGRLTRRTGSRAQPRIPAFLPSSARPGPCRGPDTRAGGAGAPGAVKPAPQEAVPEMVTSFPPEGNPAQRDH